MLGGKVQFVVWTCVVIFNNFAHCQNSGTNGNKGPSTGNARVANKASQLGKPGQPTAARTMQVQASQDAQIQGIYFIEPEDRFCRRVPNRPFYQRFADGAVCCRGRQLPVVNIVPETSGECAISTKTDANGLLDSDNLWCAYTCSLKKIGAIDGEGRVVPEVFFTHLSDGLTDASKTRIRTMMANHLDCFKPLKNTVSACHTPLSFQKCYQDALYYLCSYGMPKPEDVNKMKKLSLEYEKVSPACYYNKRKVAPSCCHGKPMPWTVVDIMEGPTNETKVTECMKNMGPECDATCYLNAVGAVNNEMELDVKVFQNQVLKHFPLVKASGWMDYLGPVFLFYDEVLADMGDESSDTAHRVCRFHDRVMELHESKVEQYCTMTPEEVKELVKNSGAA